MPSNAHSPIVRFGAGLAAVLFVIGGPVSGYFLTQILLEARASATWPSVMGKLTKVEVGETEVGRYYSDVTYLYQVGERQFTGSRIRASDGEYNIRDGAVQAIDGLTVGAPVSVFYNPTNPQQAVLRPGAGVVEYLLLLVPVVMFAIGVWLLRLLWQTR
jgi:hypothetical protein